MQMSTHELAGFFKDQPDIVSESLELSQFGFQIQCAPWPFRDDFKIGYSNVFYQTIFETIAKSGLPKSSVTFTTPEKALERNRVAGARATGWFAIGYKEPGQEFAVTVDDEAFQIRCDGILLRDLVFLSEHVFRPITQAFSSEELATPLKLAERAHTIQYNFELKLRLGKDKVQKAVVKNFDILTEALSLNRNLGTKGARSVHNAFPAVGVEKYVRLDITQHALKKIDGHAFNTCIIVQGPMNEANSTLEVDAALRMEEEFGFDLNAGLNWDTAFVSFYREILLKRFLDNLLCSTEFTNV